MRRARAGESGSSGGLIRAGKSGGFGCRIRAGESSSSGCRVRTPIGSGFRRAAERPTVSSGSAASDALALHIPAMRSAGLPAVCRCASPLRALRQIQAFYHLISRIAESLVLVAAVGEAAAAIQLSPDICAHNGRNPLRAPKFLKHLRLTLRPGLLKIVPVVADGIAGLLPQVLEQIFKLV